MDRLPQQIEDLLLREYPEFRNEGLRPIVIWIPDESAPGFAEEMRRQSILAAQSPGEREIMDWIEQVADWPKD